MSRVKENASQETVVHFGTLPNYQPADAIALATAVVGPASILGMMVLKV